MYFNQCYQHKPSYAAQKILEVRYSSSWVSLIQCAVGRSDRRSYFFRITSLRISYKSSLICCSSTDAESTSDST